MTNIKMTPIKFGGEKWKYLENCDLRSELTERERLLIQISFEYTARCFYTNGYLIGNTISDQVQGILRQKDAYKYTKYLQLPTKRKKDHSATNNS